MNHPNANAGGFLPSLISPPASVASPASTTNASTTANQPLLPTPRRHPLPPGSQKESIFISHVDARLLAISRRYENRSNLNLEEGPQTRLSGAEARAGESIPDDPAGKGYAGFGEMARELAAVLAVVWVSGTRSGGGWGNKIASLQTPYLLTLALTISTALPSFPFAPKATFWLLKKLDLALCSLLRGADVETGETLPGFQGGRGRLSTTEKVRMRGLVERTRVIIVEVAGKGGSSAGEVKSAVGAGAVGGIVTASETEVEDNLDEEEEEDFNATTVTDDELEHSEDMRVEGNHGRWEMEIARVYERTIVELGMALDVGSPGSGGFG